MINTIEFENEFINKVKNINDGKNLKYYILTMGCQLNENDSEKICGMLEQMNYSSTENIEDADIILFNTCCVRENAEDRLFGKLGEVKKYKESKGTIIAIGGCMMQEKHIVDRIKTSYPFFDLIFGTHTLYKFPEDLYNVLDKKRIEDVIDIDGEVIEGIPIKRNDKYRASVTIMNGCNNFCTYCIVPYVRGRERSRNPKDIIEEIIGLANVGYKEVTLLGQNVNSYLVSEKKKENDLQFEVKINNKDYIINSFASLLYAINAIEGIERIKFISPHPKDFSDDVIKAIKECDKVCNMIHLPLQSGSTNILKKMNRRYSKEQYLELVDKMKKEIPDVKFSTDIIVGFPGEKEADFEDTLDVVKNVVFEQVYMFIYSRRKGTPADTMEDQVEEKIKHKRFDRLKALIESQIKENNEKYVGTIQKVFVEGKSKTNKDIFTGRTESNKVVNFECVDDSLVGKIVDIKIISEHMWYLKGKII